MVLNNLFEKVNCELVSIKKTLLLIYQLPDFKKPLFDLPAPHGYKPPAILNTQAWWQGILPGWIEGGERVSVPLAQRDFTGRLLPNRVTDAGFATPGTITAFSGQRVQIT